MFKKRKRRKILKEEKPLTALEEIQADEISFVPKGANRKRLLVVKGEKEKAEKEKAAVPYKMFASAEADHPWSGDDARQRLREASSSDASGDTDKINFEKFKDFFLVYNPDKMDDLASYKMPIVDIVDKQPKIVPKALISALAAIHGARGGIELSDDEKTSALKRLEMHYKDAGMDFPSTEETAMEEGSDTKTKTEKEEAVTDLLEETTQPSSVLPGNEGVDLKEIVEQGEETDIEKQPHLVHPEFKAKCQDIVSVLLEKVQALKSSVDGLEVLTQITLAEAEQGLGYRFGRMDLYELPTEHSAEITAIAALTSRLQDKIPWSMRVCKEFLENADSMPVEKSDSLTQSDVMGMVGIEKISNSQRSIAQAAIGLLDLLAAPKTQVVDSSVESVQTEETNQAETEKENKALKEQLEKAQKELSAAKQVIQKRKSSPSSVVSSQGSSSHSVAKNSDSSDERVVWGSDMAADRNRNKQS